MDSQKYELYFKSLLDNMLEGVAIHQLIFNENNKPVDYLILKINKGYQKILGYSKEIEGKLASEVYGDIPALDIFSDIVLNKKSKNFDFYYPPMDKHFNIIASPWNDVGFISIFSDITQYIKDRELLKSKEQLYHALFEKNMYIKLLIDPYTSNIIDVNQSAIDFYGYDRETLKNMKLDEIDILPLNEILNKMKNVIKHNNLISEFKHKLANGKIRDVEVRSSVVIIDGKTYISSNIHDITEIKKSQIALKNSERRLLRAEIISKTGNWELHLNNQVIEASEGAKKIYGFLQSGNKVPYEKIKSIPLPEYRTILDLALMNLIDNDIPYDVEFKIKPFNSSNIKDIKSIASYDKKNKIIFGVIQDITSQKKNEEELEKSNAIKTTFLSNISHELKTPMNSIIGFSDLLLDKCNNDNKNTENYRFLKTININAKHLSELLNNILDSSKLENAEFDLLYENFYINDILDELSDIFKEINYQKNLNFVNIEFIKLDEDKKIISDYLRLKQILYNIINNSIKFTENGYIKISCSILGEFITFKIEDTGMGIPEDKIQYVFDRFWQFDSSSKKRHSGTGLGLSISKNLVNLLSGEIWLESTLNKGTTFYVKIPLEEIKRKKEKTDNNDNNNFSGKTILIVDEIPISYTLIGIYLNSLNINIETAYSGKECLKKFNKQKDKIDIIILDSNLPDMNLFELSKQLKSLDKNCKIISKSGNIHINELVDFNLLKPINKEELISILNNIWQK